MATLFNTVLKSLDNEPLEWVESLPTKSKEKKIILFFLHGCPDDPFSFSKQFEFFHENYTIIAPYLKGVSNKAKTNNHSYQFSKIFHEYDLILKQSYLTNDSKVIVIGHDVSGPQAYAYAKYLKEKCAGLIMINAPTIEILLNLFKSPNQWAKSSYLPAFLSPGINSLISYFFSKKIITLAAKKGGAEVLNTEVKLTPYFKHYQSALIEKIKSKKTNSLQVPTLVLWGTRDPFLNCPKKSDISKLFPNAELRIIEGKHWIHQKQSNEVNSAIQRFIQGLKL